MNSMRALLLSLLVFLQQGLAADPCLRMDAPEQVSVCSAYSPSIVEFDVTVTNTCGPELTVVCTPPSGSVFPLGTSTVHCVASNELGRIIETSFPVIVGDLAAPTLIHPKRIMVPCTGPDGTVVTFSVSASDDCDPDVLITSVPESGSLFPIGTNWVNCSAEDLSGNRRTAWFPIIVAGGCGDDPCISLDLPEDITVECSSRDGAVVSFSASATNHCSGSNLLVTCTPPSGSVLSLGRHRVHCTTGPAGNPVTGTFDVDVIDRHPPLLTTPTNLVVDAESAAGRIVHYEVSAEDACSSQVNLRCSPPSGSAFPVGSNVVVCLASDGHGNETSKVFTVTVRPPEDLLMTRILNEFSLHWTGDAQVESTDRLDIPMDRWTPVFGEVSTNGNIRSMGLSASDTIQFFRVSAPPLLPPPDEDADGVPNEHDHCFGTFEDELIDEHGCSESDLFGVPARVLGPARILLEDALRLLEEDGGFPQVESDVEAALLPDTDAVPALQVRDLIGAVRAHSNLLVRCSSALENFQRNMDAQIDAILRDATALTEENADVRAEDLAVYRIGEIHDLLAVCTAESARQDDRLNRIAAATQGDPVLQRVQIASLDSTRGLAELVDGRRLVLPRPAMPADPPLHEIPGLFATGVYVNVGGFPLPGGTIFAGSIDPENPGIGDVAMAPDPRCLQLRIVPAAVGLHLWDSGIRHIPLGYFFGPNFSGSRYHLEFGMGLAVVNVGCPSEDSYRHWVRISQDSDLNGSFYIMADYLDEHSFPVVLQESDLPEATTFPIIVREFRAEELGGGALGPTELVGEETLMVRIRPWGYYANVNYSRTIFELEDVPASSEWQSAQATALQARFPLTLEEDTLNFIAGGYKVNGQSTSFPNIQQIHLNTPFAVRVKDPNDDIFLAYEGDRGRGLFHPIVRGTRNGFPFQYRVTLPLIVRDRIASCGPNVADTYYRIPFNPVTINNNNFIGGTWNVSQGNNGGFTHNGNQAFAWDFPAAQGIPVRAARGGTVISTQESASLSCWDPMAQACQNCTGDASPNFVNIRHQDGTRAQYLHFTENSVVVSPGQRVYRGQVIAGIGTTGCSTGNHLHFHVLPNTGSVTIPATFEAYNSNQALLPCFTPPGASNGWSNNDF